MNFKNYLKYFFFITTNWNLRLAFFTIFQEIKGEKKYQIDSIEIDRLNNLTVKGENKEYASIYQGANYFLLEKSFDYLRENNATGSIVDFGSGKGRILAVAAFYGFKKITGIDFVAALCEKAKENIKKIKPLFPNTEFSIMYMDAVNYEIRNDDSIFFFFNPFEETIMLKVVKNILKSLKEQPRIIYVVYINPIFKEIFLSANFQEIFYLKKMEYLELSILSLSLNDF